MNTINVTRGELKWNCVPGEVDSRSIFHDPSLNLSEAKYSKNKHKQCNNEL